MPQVTTREEDSLKVLTVETRTGQVIYGTMVLKVTAHWAYLYGLLALRSLEGGAVEVTVSDICRLPTWTGVQPRSVATGLARHIKTSNADGLRLLTSGHGQLTKAVSLDARQVKEVKVDVDLSGLRRWLNVQPVEVMQTPNSVEAAYLLVLAEAAFEQGRYPEAADKALEAVAASPSREQHLRALALVAWSKTYGASYEEGWAAVQAFRTQWESFSEEQDDAFTKSSEALLWLQTGRFHVHKHELNKAGRAYRKAAKLLAEDQHREWGGVESGLGYIAQQSDQLDEADRRYQSALDHYTKARWPWAMHAQYNNLAAVCFLRHAEHEFLNPDVAMHWLQEAVRWTEGAMKLVSELDYGGAVDLEVNLVYAMRLMENFDQARIWLDRAWKIARASKSVTALACVWAEQAELEEALGQRHQAVSSLQEAIVYLREIGSDLWTDAAQNRLEQLQGSCPMGMPLKLW